MRTGRLRKDPLPPRQSAETPVFDALLAQAQRTAPEDLLSQEEVDRRRTLTLEDHRLADEYGAVLDRLEAEQDAEVTDTQAHLVNAVLIAAQSLRGEPRKTLAQWATYAGLPEGEIRAIVAALQAVGLNA